ncbi:MAG: hypothetical protein AAF218_08155 [Pseudomonadota bacterium]
MRVAALLAILAAPAAALTEAELAADGYAVMDCLFKQRCVIGKPCEPAWRDVRWMLSDAAGKAYQVHRGGKIWGPSVLMKDDRWADTSEARAILSPMRRAVAAHLTVFDGGGAIWSHQYAANPGSGQFYTGTCALPEAGE